MRERLIRLLIIGVIAIFVLILAKGVADWRTQGGLKSEKMNFSNASFKEKLEDLGGQILGQTAKVLPGESDLEIDQENQEIEPIEKPKKNIEDLTEALIEALKALPQDQLEATKKQIRQEFCEGFLEEE